MVSATAAYLKARRALAVSNALAGKAVPIAIGAPSISGTVAVGSTVTGAHGDYTSTPSSYTYRWLLNGSAIAGATALTYVAQVGDATGTLVFEETPTNAIGAGAASASAGKTVAAVAPAAPSLTVTPGNAQNVITWTDGSTGGAAITAHNLYRGTASGGEVYIGQIVSGSPYTDTGLTNGVTYYYKLSAVNAAGEGPKSAEVTGAPGIALAFGSTWNQSGLQHDATFSNGTVGQTYRFTRYPILLGSGDSSEIRLSFTQYCINATSTFTTTNSMDIVACAVEIGSNVVPVTFSGSRTKTIAASDLDIQSDAVLPSAFSLSQFARGTVGWIRLITKVTNTGDKFAICSLATGTMPTGTQAFYYHPSSSPQITSSLVDTTGVVANTTGTYGVAFAWAPMLLVRPVSSTFQAVLGIGDSHIAGGADTTPAVAGALGFYRRAIYGNGTTTALAGCGFGVSGGRSLAWFSGDYAAYQAAYMKYAAGGQAFISYDTNDIAPNGPTGNYTDMVNKNTLLVTMLKAAGITRIGRLQLFPRTTGTFTSDGGQAYSGTNWQPGGDAPNMRAWYISRIGVLYDYLVYGAQCHSSSDYDKWANNAGVAITADGIHPNSNALGQPALATELRTGLGA